MTRRWIFRLAAAALGLALVAVGVTDAATSARGGAGPTDKLQLIAPAAPGGGWDSVARELQGAADEHSLANSTEVLNVPGAGGTIGLARLSGQGGRGDTLMLSGAVMMGSIAMTGSETTLQDVTPIARLADDYSAVVVPADSPYQSINDLVAAWQKDPLSVAIGGGSAGGTDHLLTGLLMETSGIDTDKLNYIAYSGGGEVVAGMLNGGLDAGVSSYDDFADQIKTGELRALGISSDERLPGVHVPTFIEQGVDVELANWRGLVAPPGITDEQRAELTRMAVRMHDTPEWRDALERNGWEDTFQTGDDFQRFIDAETKRINRISQELGLS